MKGKINKNGCLILMRGKSQKEKETFCGFRPRYGTCNDECPLFNEPEYDSKSYEEEIVILKLCFKTLLFSKKDFVDERE